MSETLALSTEDNLSPLSQNMPSSLSSQVFPGDSHVFCYSSVSQRLTCHGQEVILIFWITLQQPLSCRTLNLAFFEGQQKVATVGRQFLWRPENCNDCKVQKSLLGIARGEIPEDGIHVHCRHKSITTANLITCQKHCNETEKPYQMLNYFLQSWREKMNHHCSRISSGPARKKIHLSQPCQFIAIAILHSHKKNTTKMQSYISIPKNSCKHCSSLLQQ